MFPWYLKIKQQSHARHGAIIGTGITCKKYLVTCATQFADGLLFKLDLTSLSFSLWDKLQNLDWFM